MLTKIIAIACALAIGAGTALAASADKPQRTHRARTAAPATPPPPEVARLMAFRGVWNFEGTVTVGTNKPRKVRWRMGCSQTAGGWAVACDHTIRIPRMPVMQMHEVAAWSDGALHMFMADNGGSAHMATGNWIDERTLRVHHEATQGGQPMVEDVEIVLRDDTTMDFRNSVTVAGKPFMAFKGTFRQQPKRTRTARGTPTQQPMPDATTQAAPAPAQ